MLSAKGLQQHLLARGKVSTIGEDIKGQASELIEHLNPCGLLQVYSTALGSLGNKPKVKLPA